MNNCRACDKAFEPTPYQIRKSDFLCRECWRNYRRQRKAEGHRTSGPSRSYKVRKTQQKRYRSLRRVIKRRMENAKRYVHDPRLNPRYRARWKSTGAVKRGEIKRQPCSSCGSSKSEQHHPDYSKPLLIEWLCRQCHAALHLRLKSTAAKGAKHE